jgi:hypothetical protein
LIHWILKNNIKRWNDYLLIGHSFSYRIDAEPVEKSTTKQPIQFVNQSKMNYNQLQNELSPGALEWATERNLIKKPSRLSQMQKAFQLDP